MRSIYKAVAAAAMVVAVTAALATAAFAAPEWYKGTPGWQQSKTTLGEAVAVRVKGPVKLSDSGSSVVVECQSSGEGTAGAGAAGSVTKLTLSACATKAGSCGTPTAAAANMPWRGELSVAGGAVHDTLVNSGKGEPRLQWTCTVFGIKITDVCEGALDATLVNEPGGVSATFDGKKLNCSVGGEGAGTIEGTPLVEAVSGTKLEVSAAAVLTKLTSSVEVASSGELTITDTRGFDGEVSVRCVGGTKGTVGSGGVGQINSYIVTSCESDQCSTFKVESVHLPWRTELYESAGRIRQRIVSGGSGTPEWKYECSAFGMSEVDSCGLNTSAGMTNQPGGDVDASFDEETALTGCSHGGSESGKWRGTLTIALPSGAIEVMK